MARFRRVAPSGTVQHIISRYVNREIRVDQQDQRDRLASFAARSMRFTDWSPLGFAFMGNHNHWACVAGEAPLRSFFHPVNSSFASWLNGRQKRLGPLFGDRPRNITFSDERVAYLLAYIHNNPVRAGVVDDPADSIWSTHRIYIGELPAPAWLDVERGLSLCGFSASPSGRLSFHDFVRSRSGDPRDPTMTGEELPSVQSDVRGQLGTAAELVSAVGDRSEYGVLARPMSVLRLPYRGSPTTVLDACARSARVTTADLRSRSRSADVVAARRLVLTVWCLELGGTQAEMAALLGISQPAASRMLGSARRVSALREKAARVANAVRRGATRFP